MSVETQPTVDESDHEPSAGRGWWRQPFSVFQTNLQEVDAVMDVDEVLDFIQSYGADTWLINTGGISSFYPTDLPFQTRNPFLADRPSGDLIGDAVAAAHERHIRVIARLDLSKVAAPIAHEHPEWLFVSPAGRPQVYNTLFSTCPSGDYYQQRSLDILDEVMDRYPVDGFFVNWFSFSERDYSRVYHGVCHCTNCQEAFGDYNSAKALPSGPESQAYAEWLRFANQTITALTAKIADHIARRRSDVGLILGRGAPIIYHEANNAFGRELWHHSTAEATSAHVSARPEVPLMVNSVSFVDMPYRMAGEQPEHFAQYLIQAIARGGNPSTYIMGAPGRIPYANISLGQTITRFHRKHATLYEQLRPAATIALVRPDPARRADPRYGESVEEFRGIYSSLQEKHHPFDVIPVEQISKMAQEYALGRYSLIILPDLGPLGPVTGSTIDTFVQGGGNVLTTGTSGLTDEGRVELATSPALMRVGAPMTGEALWSTYVTDHDQPKIDAYRYTAQVIPVFGNYSRFVWKPSGTRIGYVLPQAPFGPPEKCFGHTRSADPAMVHARAGAGQVTVVPWSIGRTYREFGTTQVRDQLLSAVESLAQVTVSARLAEQVELIVGRDDGGYVLHLINQSGARRRSFGPHLTIVGGQLRLRDPGGPARAETLVSDQQLEPRVDGNDVVLDLPPLELFEVVRVSSGGTTG